MKFIGAGCGSPSRRSYVDRAGIYRSEREPTPAEIVADVAPRTQFGRAMDELGVRLNLARSPQEKGRVERMNGTLLDRLVKDLRRAGIAVLATANRFLEEEFPAQFNARFKVPPADPQDASRPCPAAAELAKSMTACEERTVQNDWTIRWNNRFLQLPKSAAGTVRAGSKVEVREHHLGTVRVFCGGMEQPWSETRSEPAPARKPPCKPARRPPTGGNSKPAADHPWRRGFGRSSTSTRGSGRRVVRLGRAGLLVPAVLPALPALS